MLQIAFLVIHSRLVKRELCSKPKIKSSHLRARVTKVKMSLPLMRIELDLITRKMLFTETKVTKRTKVNEIMEKSVFHSSNTVREKLAEETRDKEYDSMMFIILYSKLHEILNVN